MERKVARYRRLDRLRDVAAVMVVLSHIPAMVVNPALGDEMSKIWMKVLWSLGGPAVDMFLVLSGYVVALAWMRQYERGGTAGNFYAGRIIRLMPVYLVSFGIALVCWSIMQALMPPTGSSMELAMTQPSIAGIIANIGPFWPTHTTLILNPPWWTLQVEFMAMFVIPPMVAVMLKEKVAIGFVWMLMAFVIQQCLAFAGIPGTGQYICLITVMAGAMIAVSRKKNDGVIITVDRLMKGKGFRILTTSIAIAIIVAIQAFKLEGLPYQITRPVGAIAAVLVLIVLTSDHRRRRSRPHRRSDLKPGETSYALYAIHYPMMMLGASLVASIRPESEMIIAGGILGAVAAIVISHIVTYRVERDAVRRSRQFMERRLAPDELFGVNP